MSKSFVNAPKPRALSADVIAAFERRGAGQDTLPPKVEMGEPAVAPPPPPPAAPQEAPKEALRRLSLDLPESLHRRFKTACSATDRKMVSEVLEFIERRTADLEARAAAARG